MKRRSLRSSSTIDARKRNANDADMNKENEYSDEEKQETKHTNKGTNGRDTKEESAPDSMIGMCTPKTIKFK